MLVQAVGIGLPCDGDDVVEDSSRGEYAGLQAVAVLCERGAREACAAYGWYVEGLEFVSDDLPEVVPVGTVATLMPTSST